MSRKFIILFVLLFVNFISSQNKMITGNLSGFKNGDKVLLDDPEIVAFIDSAYIQNGKFSMVNKLSEVPKILYITIKSASKFYSARLFISRDNVVVTGDKNDFPYNVKIEGSKEHDKFTILENQIKPYRIERNEIVAFLRKDIIDTSLTFKSLRKSKQERLHAVDKITDSIKKAYIKSNLNSYAAINELFDFRDKYTNQELNELYDGLQVKYQNSIYGKRLSSYLSIGNVLKVEDPYCDFEAIDQFGKKRNFSEFIGKYVLLDFTEAYCVPCVRSIKELKEVAKMNSEKLTIISFYADKSELVWKKALDRDQPTWITLFDGKGSGGKTLLKYGIQGYPTFFLLDPSGKIVHKAFGYEDHIIKSIIQNHIK